MKKTLLMLLILLSTSVSVWADKVTDLSQLSNDKVYTIRSERAFLLYSENLPSELCSSTGRTWVVSLTVSVTPIFSSTS